MLLWHHRHWRLLILDHWSGHHLAATLSHSAGIKTLLKNRRHWQAWWHSED
jgi:hypothetical protein